MTREIVELETKIMRAKLNGTTKHKLHINGGLIVWCVWLLLMLLLLILV